MYSRIKAPRGRVLFFRYFWLLSLHAGLVLKGSVQVLVDIECLQVFESESRVKLTWLNCLDNPVSFCSNHTNKCHRCKSVAFSTLRLDDISNNVS